MDMIIVIMVLIIKIIMMINTNMMLDIRKPFDQVRLLLITYCLYHLFFHNQCPHYSDHGHDHSDHSLDHQNNDEDQHKYDVRHVKIS